MNGFESYWPLCKRMARRISQSKGRPAEAEDAAQCAWIDLWRKDDLSEPDRGGLIPFIIRRSILHYFRYRKPLHYQLSECTEKLAVTYQVEPLHLEVEQIIASIAPRSNRANVDQWRRVLELRFLEDMSQKAVAVVVGINQQRVSQIECKVIDWIREHYRARC